MRKPLAICVALGGLSLLLPSEPSYDPWAWLVWGREIALFDLDTNGGPSWKPLPVLFTMVFSPLSKIGDGIPPALWLVVARAGGLFALYMAFRLAGRLAGGDRPVRWGAGVLAAIALLLTPLWIRYMAHGNEAPMAIAMLLWAIDRHLDDRRDPGGLSPPYKRRFAALHPPGRRDALILGFLACLLRPEVAPFLGVYGVWIFWREPGLRRLAVGLAVALPVLWLVPEWIGSGNPLGAGQKATGEPPWSLSLKDKPWLAALERAHSLVGLVLEIGVAAAVGVAIARREKAVLALAGVAAVWILLIVGMTEAGFSGNSRYFLVPLAIACVLGGVGAAKLVQLAPRPPAQAAIAVLVLAAAGLYVQPRFDRVDFQLESAGRLADLQNDLEQAVDRAGGPDAVAANGVPTVNRGFVTRMAWEAKLSIGEVEDADGEAIIFAARSKQAGTPPRAGRGRKDLTTRFEVGRWKVLAPRGQPVAVAP